MVMSFIFINVVGKLDHLEGKITRVWENNEQPVDKASIIYWPSWFWQKFSHWCLLQLEQYRSIALSVWTSLKVLRLRDW